MRIIVDNENGFRFNFDEQFKEHYGEGYSEVIEFILGIIKKLEENNSPERQVDAMVMPQFELLIKEEIKAPTHVTMTSIHESTVEFNHGIIAGLNRSISLLRRVLKV